MAGNPYEYIINMKQKKNTEAQLALQNALISLNQHKAIYKISTKELCGQAHVARSTFGFSPD